MDNKSSKVQKKVSKHKLKETEMEEQLKLARSLINNVERKLGEVQNSNKILKQEINLIKTGAAESGVAQPMATPEVHAIPAEPLKERPSEVDDSQFMHLRDQVRNLELEMVKHRLLVLESFIRHQGPYPFVQQGIYPHITGPLKCNSGWLGNCPYVYGGVQHGPQMFQNPLYGNFSADE